MALEYDFDISSSMTWEQAKPLLAKRLDAEWCEGNQVYKQPDLLITGWDVSPGPRTEVTEEAFHFTPTLGFFFRCQHDSDYDSFRILMLRATMAILEHGRDAVLLFNGEIIVFQRLGGHLVFNSDYVIWSDDALLKEVRGPFERRSLPSPLL